MPTNYQEQIVREMSECGGLYRTGIDDQEVKQKNYSNSTDGDVGFRVVRDGAYSKSQARIEKVRYVRK